MISPRALLIAVLTALPGLGTTSLTQAAAVPAASADAFVDTMGVCTHWQYADTVYGKRFPELKARLVELGLRHVRDGGGNETFIARTRELAASGIRTTILLDPGTGTVPNESYWTPSSAKRYLITDFIKRTLSTNAVSGVEV
ncbi:MAG TPA: hypothetical protein VNT26_08830, partial [Candidatus Sulfotelmatobacter sp.]|nr:hypothetical protein [Candidatus Sulfotelmatobacter sp.]